MQISEAAQLVDNHNFLSKEERDRSPILSYRRDQAVVYFNKEEEEARESMEATTSRDVGKDTLKGGKNLSPLSQKN